MGYVCFIVDAFSRTIVGRLVAGHMRTVMVLDVLEMARWSRGTRLEGLVTHSDAGSQYTSIGYGERFDEIGAVPSIGSIGDSFDSAITESVNALYKAELIYGPDQGPRKTVEEVELATFMWVKWSTGNGSTGISTTSHQPRLRTPTMPKGAAHNRSETNRNSLQHTQYAPVPRHVYGMSSDNTTVSS